MTLQGLLNLVADWCDDPGFGYIDQSIVTTRLNLATRELNKILCNANEDFYTKSVKTNLVANQQIYALPSDFSKIQLLEVVVSGSGVTAITQPLVPIVRIQKYMFSGGQTGTPQGYFLNEGNLILWPVPDSIQELRLDYSRTVVDMVSTTDSPDAPERYHEYPAICVSYDNLIKDNRNNAFLKIKKDQYEDTIRSDSEQRSQDYPRTIVNTLSGGMYDL